jgi:carbamoyltransferase
VAAVLGINAVFHDPAAAIVVDGRVVAAAEEERFSRRKHGKPCVPFSTWELPEAAARWCLREARLDAGDLDAIAYSYDPALDQPTARARRLSDVAGDGWESLRTFYAERAPLFLRAALPGLDAARVHFVPHHLAHAASAYLAGPHDRAAVLVLDGRGECSSHLAGAARGGAFHPLASQALPHSLGLFYETATEHLGFRRASDEYKVMALAAYGAPRFLPALREAVRVVGHGFRTEAIDFSAFAPRRREDEPWSEAHADLAASVQQRLEEALLELAHALHRRTRLSALAYAGGVALNCVANARLAREGPFEHVWVQPAAGDAGTALGAALYVARKLGDAVDPVPTAALGCGFTDEEIERQLGAAAVSTERPGDVAERAAETLARDGIVGWFQGRSEFGPRALGHRSLLANPCFAHNVERLNEVKGRESFRPVAPMVSLERAGEIFEGRLPSPHMLFTHRVRPQWRERIPSAVHVDGTARVQTVDPAEETLLARLLAAFEKRTGVPVLVNTSFNTGSRPMVDQPRDALECFASSPIDALAIGPFFVRRARGVWQ